jgi:predicted membrane chloride channel (bestrophin family)
LIAEDIEEPFGRDDDDLPLDSLCSDMKKVVGRILDVAAHQKYTASIERPRLDLLRDQLRS